MSATQAQPGVRSVRAAPRVAVFLCVLLLGLTSACHRDPPARHDSADARQDESPAHESARVAVLSPALAIILRDLGLEHLAVARHAYDMALDPGLPVGGDQTGIDYESLLRVEPTDILIQWGARPLPERLRMLAEQRGWRLHTFDPLTLGDIRDATLEIHRLFAPPAANGEPDPPPLIDRMDAAWSPPRGADLSRAGRVLLLASTSPPAALGPGSFHHQLLEAIGGRPAITEGAPYINLDGEDILRLDPDAIILFYPTPAGGGRAAGLPSLGVLERLDLRARRNHRLGVVDDPHGLTPSTAMVGVADRMAEMLKRWSRD